MLQVPQEKQVSEKLVPELAREGLPDLVRDLLGRVGQAFGALIHNFVVDLHGFGGLGGRGRGELPQLSSFSPLGV